MRDIKKMLHVLCQKVEENETALKEIKQIRFAKYLNFKFSYIPYLFLCRTSCTPSSSEGTPGPSYRKRRISLKVCVSTVVATILLYCSCLLFVA